MRKLCNLQRRAVRDRVLRARTTGIDAERADRLRQELAKGKGNRTWHKIAAQCGYSSGASAQGAATRMGLFPPPVDISDL